MEFIFTQQNTTKFTPNKSFLKLQKYEIVSIVSSETSVPYLKVFYKNFDIDFSYLDF